MKADAERFVREEEVALERGAWSHPRAAEMTLADWCDRFMSLARRLAVGVKERHIRRLIAERRIPFIKWGHLIRFDPDDIVTWLNDNRQAAG